MANEDRPRVSRRRMIAVSLGVPAVSMMSPPVASLDHDSMVSDPIADRAAAWIAEHQRLDALTLEWGNLETQLRRKAGRLGVDTEDARRQGLPEARAMRVLDEKIEASHREMADLAEAVSLMQAVSVVGALAKLELGLRVQGKYSWQDNAMALLEGGAEELRTLLARGR
jgi:hypothetical protein